MVTDSTLRAGPSDPQAHVFVAGPGKHLFLRL